MRRVLLILAICAALSLPIPPAAAQTPVSGPVYIVQSGDTLTTIALRFNVSVSDLMSANNLTDPNLLNAGQQLVIPGLEGITGVLTTQLINFGDSLRSIERRAQVPQGLLMKLNHLDSPAQLFVGSNLILPTVDNAPELTNRLSPSAGESLLELAVQANTDPWTLASLNSLKGTWDSLPGDVLYAPGAAGQNETASGLPTAFVSAQIEDLPLVQGSTAEIVVQTGSNVSLSGTLGDYSLHFFPLGDGRLLALQGIHAMLAPGVYPLQLDATLADGTKQSFAQLVLISSANFPKEALSVSSELIDPAVTGPEDKQVAGITAPLTPAKKWQGLFSLPIYLPAGVQLYNCTSDRFGTRRSFNGSEYIYFHSGLDFVACIPPHSHDIYAAAAGTVIFAGPLTVRGNATFIDHGWGVYTAYYHQSEIDVSVGQQVQAGQLIGQIGATGRVTGPHLHFEVWVNDIQVNPLDWLNRAFP